MEENDIKLSKTQKGFQMKWMERISKQIGVLCLYPQKNFEILYINELLLLELKYDSQEAFQRGVVVKHFCNTLFDKYLTVTCLHRC